MFTSFNDTIALPRSSISQTKNSSMRLLWNHNSQVMILSIDIKTDWIWGGLVPPSS